MAEHRSASSFFGGDGGSLKDFPARAWVYTGAVVALATGLTLSISDGAYDVATLVGFGLLVLVAEAVPVELAHASYSVGFLVVIAAMVASGPATAALAAAFGAVDPGLRRRRDRVGRFFFNGGQLCLSAGLAGWVYRMLGGPVGDLSWTDFPRIFMPIAGAAAVHFVVNVVLVSTMVSLVRKVRWRELWHSDYRAASLSYFSFAVLGLFLALLFLHIGWGAVLFFLLPLLVVRGGFHASAQLQTAFDATFASLVTAIEAKDLYTRGHAERVSRLSEMIARERRLPEVQVRKIRYAALMHDVGKLTVDTRILQKPGKLTSDEFEHMKIHPIRGSEIVAEIDLLTEMVDGVRHHHERLDGRGYPDGLHGNELSPAARIIMVADAFDSMTSTRSYRRAMPVQAAFAELRRCQATQFAPEMIEALRRAVDKHGWQPSPEAFEGEQAPRPEDMPNRALG